MIDPTLLAKRMRALPAFSSSVVALDRVLAGPNPNLGEVESVITHDPALTANLLRFANSSLYHLSRPAHTVRQAALLLGLRRVRELALAAGFGAVLPARIAGYELTARQYWTHSVAVAILSAELAPVVGIPEPDQVFVAGLLHDLGKLVLGSFLADSGEAIRIGLDQRELTLLETERQILGTDHARVGLELAQQWKLPRSIAAVAEWHHCPDLAQNDEHAGLADLVQVADSLAHVLGCGSDVGELARQPHAPSLTRLGLNRRHLEVVASTVWDRIAQARELVGSAEAD